MYSILAGIYVCMNDWEMYVYKLTRTISYFSEFIMPKCNTHLKLNSSPHAEQYTWLATCSRCLSLACNCLHSSSSLIARFLSSLLSCVITRNVLYYNCTQSPVLLTGVPPPFYAEGQQFLNLSSFLLPPALLLLQAVCQSSTGWSLADNEQPPVNEEAYIVPTITTVSSFVFIGNMTWQLLQVLNITETQIGNDCAGAELEGLIRKTKTIVILWRGSPFLLPPLNHCSGVPDDITRSEDIPLCLIASFENSSPPCLLTSLRFWIFPWLPPALLEAECTLV